MRNDDDDFINFDLVLDESRCQPMPAPNIVQVHTETNLEHEYAA